MAGAVHVVFYEAQAAGADVFGDGIDGAVKPVHRDDDPDGPARGQFTGVSAGLKGATTLALTAPTSSATVMRRDRSGLREFMDGVNHREHWATRSNPWRCWPRKRRGCTASRTPLTR